MSPNPTGDILAAVCDELGDKLRVKYGSQWPVVVAARGLMTEPRASALRRTLSTMSARRAVRTRSLNRVVLACYELGVTSDKLRILGS